MNIQNLHGVPGEATKFIAFLRSDAPLAPDALLARAYSLAGDAGFSRVIANLVLPTPPDTPYRPPTEIAASSEPPCLMLLELAAAEPLAGEQLLPMLQAAFPGMAVHLYRGEEMVEKDAQPFVLRARSPGIKYMGRLMFHADLPDSAAMRSWNLHVPLALKVHVGASKYVRNWVTGSWGEAAPPTRAITELHFRTMEDLVERFFDSDRGRGEILQDTAHFIESGSRYYVAEHVLKA